jgi:cytochrome c oxidase subunit II
MRSSAPWPSLTPGILIFGLAFGVAGCTNAPSPLDPRTTGAARIAELGWVMIALATVVCGVVFGALVIALRTVPRQPEAEQRRSAGTGADRPADRAVIVAGMVIPTAILVFTFGYTVYTLRQVAGVAGTGGAPAVAAHGDHTVHGTVGAPAALLADTGILPAVTVRLTGHQWWWQIEYPDHQVVTANEIHIPAGVPVQVSVASEDVIHSFWVPQVTGKVDLIPGKVNAITVRADQPGAYRGLCAEFCGLQHAHMHLRLIVTSADEFVGWVAQQQRTAALPTTPAATEGRQIFVSQCGECHTVRGTSDGTRGPDLTHLASRRTLGAGIHDFNRANLEGWTRDPQSMKPGNRMPNAPLDDREVAALVEYLEGLE